MRRALLTTVAVCIAIFAGLMAFYGPLGLWLMTMVHRLRELGIAGGLLYALTYVLLTLVFVPQTPLSLGAGFLYGTLWGAVIISVASTITGTIAFLLARYCFRDFAVHRLSRFKQFERIDSAIEQNGFKLVLLMRLQPVFVPFAYLNVGLGVTRVRLLDYVLGTFLGTLPGTILIAYLGSAIKDLSFLASHAWTTEQMTAGWFFWIGLLAVAALSILLAQIARQSFASAVKQHPELTDEG